MPWRPLPRIAFAVCTFPFQPSSPADLPLEIGDELYIIEQGGGDGTWYRGYLVAPPSLLAGLTTVEGQTLEARVFSGIFPRSCVDVREVLGEERSRSRACDSNAQPHRVSGQTSALSNHGEVNGMLTPSESASPTPTAGLLGGHKAKRGSKNDGPTTIEPSVAPSMSVQRRKSSKPEALRLMNAESRLTTRSEASQLALPLSPMSTSPRGPNSPRPPAPVPMLKIGDETPTSAQEPLVDEIASCLREWHSTKLHELLLARRYSSLDKMSGLVHCLDGARRQLLHKVLTAHELRKLRETTVWDLVSGNKMLSGEVIVRSPSQRGRILTAEDSPVEITKLQSVMSLLAEKPVPHVDEHIIHHLLVDIASITGNTNSKTLAMHLCSKAPGSALMPLSEVHAVDLFTRESPPHATSEMGRKTLFVDLSSSDIGEGPGAGSSLYLVFKILANEALHGAATRGTGSIQARDGNSVQSGSGSTASQAGGSLRGGRRSLMWGQKARKDSETRIKGQEQRPSTRDSNKEKASDPRPSSSNVRRSPTTEQMTAKRVVAVGFLRVDPLLRGDQEADQEVTLWSPLQPTDEQTERDQGWDSLVKEILPSRTGEYRKLPLVGPLRAFVKPFTSPEAETLIKRTPTLLHNISQTRKIGFSGAPNRPRSDIYLTLSEAMIPRNAFLSHPKSGTASLGPQHGLANLQLTLEVRRSSGQRIENCIYPSCNSAGHTAWRTTAVERGEAWDLTIRLAISPEDVPGSHIVMSIADVPGFPFALCWMPLWTQEAFTQDGQHSLVLYQYDEYTSSMISGRGAYLALPWNHKKREEASAGPMAALNVRTYLCSTLYSQDPILLGLLKWKDQSAAELISLLRRFVFVPEIEVVKLLSEVFDALFDVLVEYAGSDDYEDLVFDALVFVLSIVHDRRFNLSPLVDQYAETRFMYPSATPCLVRSFRRLLSTPTDPETSRKLRSTFKVGTHIFKFLVKARQQQEQKEASSGLSNNQSTFKKDVRSMFISLEDLMQHSAPILIGSKTLAVHHFHTWLPEIAHLMAPKEVLEIVTGFIDACANAQGKLVLYKLVLIIHFAQLETFKAPDTRRQLLIKTVRWLAPYWGNTAVVTEQWKNQVRLCCSVVASQMNSLGEEASDYIPKLVDSYIAIQSSPREPKKYLSLLFPTSYPFPTKTTPTDTNFDEALAEIAAVLAATTNLPSVVHLDLPKPQLAEFLTGALQVYISILDGGAFPKTWLSVHIYHHKAIMRSLEKLSSILIDSFLPHPDEADQFNTDLWRAFFDALLKLVGSDALALETFPEQKRRAVWKIAGDVRELGADLLRRSWEAIGWETSAEDRRQYGLEKLGGYQVQYVPGLVEPIVELCLSVHEGLRSVAIEILQTMIVSEWTLSQDLSLIQAEMIDCLDVLFKSKNHSESILQKLFIGELVGLFVSTTGEADDPLFSAVKGLVATIDELLDLLVAVHSTEASGETFHILDTLRLMDFLKDMHKEDIFIRYVHQLAHLQAKARNYTEAGLAIRLHADLYEWEPTLMLEPLRDPDFAIQSSFARKEQLYFQMIKHYEDGQSWDNALGSYMELAEQYEHNTFDFAKLARTQRAMATVYDSIYKGDRQSPRYFRVVYQGLGFPTSIRDKQFIFQGLPADRLTSFTDRLQQQHPSAQILHSTTEEDIEGQYIQVYPVSPQRDLTHPIYQRAKVSQSVRDYYLLSRPSTFTTSSRRQTNEEGVKEQTVEKTMYTTVEPLPTILRRSEIVDTRTITLTPLQMAIERTIRKNVELVKLEKKLTDGEDTAIVSLTELLMISVDPLSESSIAHYRELLQRPEESIAEDEEREERPLDPLENALRVALIDFALTVKRCLGLFSRSAHQATKADLTKRFETTFAPELEALSLEAHAPGQTSLSNRSWSPSTETRPLPSAQAAASAEHTTSPKDAAPVRNEKHRLSLTFLKRASMRDPKMFRSNSVRENGVTHVIEEDEPRKPTQAGATHHPTAAQVIRQNSVQHSLPGDHSESGKSENSGGDYTLRERVGNVKRRLSVLNIGMGKKTSKSSVRDRDGRIEHEVLEE